MRTLRIVPLYYMTNMSSIGLICKQTINSHYGRRQNALQAQIYFSPMPPFPLDKFLKSAIIVNVLIINHLTIAS